MFPGTAKFQTRPASPQFANFKPPGDYPHSGHTGHIGHGGAANTQTTAIATHSVPAGIMNNSGAVGINTVGNGDGGGGGCSGSGSGDGGVVSSTSMMNAKVTTVGVSKSQRNAGLAMDISTGSAHHIMSGTSTMGHHRGELIFPDDMDSIEFCMPPPPAPSNGIEHGVNGELLLIHGANGSNGLCEAFTERRRHGHIRRSNHKMDVEQQVKWSRKNIAATMERFEPTSGGSGIDGHMNANAHSSSSASSLEYGFAAGVITPTTSTPAHHQQQRQHHSPVPSATHAYNTASVSGAGAASASAIGGPFNHVYSYAYYEPGVAKCHTNIPYKEGTGVPPPPIISAPPIVAASSKSPPRNSIRALLAKSFRSKSSFNSGQSTSSSPSNEERHTYTTRYGTTENLYEEVNEQKIRKVLSDNRIATTSIGNVKEELRRVQHNHFRVLDELNLSLEALIMPPTPPDVSPNQGPDDDEDGPSTSAAAVATSAQSAVNAASAASSTATSAQRARRGGLLGGAAYSSSSTTSSQQRTLSHASLENLSTTLNSMELKDHTHNSCINPEFDEGDLDSGFSGSGSSSGASYNESLRYYKTGTNHHHPYPHHHHQHNSNINNNNNNNNNNHMMQTTTLPHNLRSCRSSTASGTSTSKVSMGSSEDPGIAGMCGVNGMDGMSGLGTLHSTSIISGGGASSGSGGMGCGSALSPFNYSRRCSDTQRSSVRSISGSAAATAMGAKPKKNFWTIKP